MQEIKFRVYLKEYKVVAKVLAIDFEDKDITFESDEIEEWGNCVDFDDTILMKNTGLKDKNGVEIYEGDVVRILCKEEELLGTIKFGRKDYKWTTNYAYGFYVDFPNKELKSEIYYWIEKYGIEVIGNVYSSPGLLDVK